jgi:hypothetical protein
MEQGMHILTLLSAVAAGSLVSAIWQGVILAIGAALCLRSIKGTTAGLRSVLWTGVFLLVVLLHFVPLFMRGSSAVVPRMPGSILHLDLHWSLAIACVWGLFSLVRGVQLIQSAIGLRRIARRATPVVHSTVFPALLRTGYRSAELCISVDVDRPSVIGFFTPRILLPQVLFEKLSAAELEQIVMHEMEHLRRLDDWTNLLQKLSLVLFPLNPVLLCVERRLCIERELACDDHVLSCTKARKAYATCLVSLAEHSVLRRSASLVLGAWERQSELGRRVRRILRQPEGAMGRRQMKLVTSTLLLGMVGGALALAREPQLVSFMPLAPTRTEASLPPASGFVPASFHVQAPSPRMVNTVFQEPRTAPQTAPRTDPQTEPRTAPRTAETLVTTKPHRHQPSHKSPHNSAVLNAATRSVAWRDTSGHQTPQAATWVMLTVSEETPPSYAAIQTANGWLIVQL